MPFLKQLNKIKEQLTQVSASDDAQNSQSKIEAVDFDVSRNDYAITQKEKLAELLKEYRRWLDSGDFNKTKDKLIESVEREISLEQARRAAEQAKRRETLQEVNTIIGEINKLTDSDLLIDNLPINPEKLVDEPSYLNKYLRLQNERIPSTLKNNFKILGAVLLTLVGAFSLIAAIAAIVLMTAPASVPALAMAGSVLALTTTFGTTAAVTSPVTIALGCSVSIVSAISLKKGPMSFSKIGTDWTARKNFNLQETNLRSKCAL